MPQKVLSAEKVVDSSEEASNSSSSSSEEESINEKQESRSNKRKSSSSPKQPSKRAKSSHSRDHIGTTAQKKTGKNSWKKKQQNEDSDSDSDEVDGETSEDKSDSSDAETAPNPGTTAKDKAPPIRDKSNHVPAPASSQTSCQTSPKVNSVKVSRSRITWQPPPGFVAANSDPQFANSNARQLLSAGALKGKELWHIVAPASVPLSSIETLRLDQIQGSKKILSHESRDFALKKGEKGMDRKVLAMVPSNDGTTYSQISVPFKQTLHLQQIIPAKIQAISSNSKSKPKTQASVPEPRKPPQQPPGLRVRYWPAGFEDRRQDRPEAQQQTQPQATSSADQKPGKTPKGDNQKATSMEKAKPVKEVPASSSSSSSASESSDDSESSSNSDENQARTPKMQSDKKPQDAKKKKATPPRTSQKATSNNNKRSRDWSSSESESDKSDSD